MQATSDRRLIFAGKSDLKILELLDNKGTLLNKGKNVASFIDIKLIANNQLLVHEDSTLDLVVYDSEFREIKRLPRANNGHNPFFQTFKTIKHGSANNFYGWFSGSDELRIVNLTTGEFTPVANFFGSSGQKALPIAVAVSDNDRKAAGLFSLGSSMEVFLSILTPNGAVSRNSVDSLIKRKGRPI